MEFDKKAIDFVDARNVFRVRLCHTQDGLSQKENVFCTIEYSAVIPKYKHDMY